MPPGGPRTKPRALNAALPLARGDLLTVYDAEDVPDPGHCGWPPRCSRSLPGSTACLQGRLVIDNTGDSRLARAFALEYAGLFDVLNPALARCRLPVPLGGTSMHLRTGVLRALHGWDAHNVTEDADLGHAPRAGGLHGRRPAEPHLRGGAGPRRPLARASAPAG